jgi:flagellar motor switch protein FliG
MKKPLCIILLAVSIMAVGQKEAKKSKADKQMEKDAMALAEKMCGCIQGIIEDYHPALQTMMTDMVEKTEQEAQAKFAEIFATLAANEQQKIMKDIERMQNFEPEMAEKCGNKLEEEYAKYNENAEFESKMLEGLKDLPKCSLTYQMMLLGQKKK